MKNLCIVVPVYNKTPKSWEVESLKQLARRCPGYYDICFIYPESWTQQDIETYDNIIFNIDTKRTEILHKSFSEHCFESTVEYSQLLKYQYFYTNFSDYKYILIYQTDCWAFDLSKLEAWIDKDFDYIGPPIITNKKHWPSAPCCGNGGLSLRKVSSFIKYTTDANLHTKLDNESEIYRKYEDVYFCEGISQYYFMDMPTWEECAVFAWDMNPDVLYRKFETLPEIGIHAWPKNLPFWIQHGLSHIPKEAQKDAYEDNKDFINVYYKRT